MEDGSNITGLGKEICDVYQGPDVLSHYLIKRLQTQQLLVRSEPLPPMPVNEEDDMVDIFEEWAVTVNRCYPAVQAKKDVIWNLIRRHKDIAIQLLECDIYSKGDEYSNIRMVYECRKRLNHHSKKLDLAQKYQSPGFMNKMIGILENHSESLSIPPRKKRD